MVALAEHFLGEHAAAHRLAPRRLDAGARAWLLAYTWPGNVRELSHLMERVTLLSSDEEIGRGTLESLRVPLVSSVTESRPADEDDGDDEAARIQRDARSHRRQRRARGEACSVSAATRSAIACERFGIGTPDEPGRGAGIAHAGARAPGGSGVGGPAVDPRWEQKPVAVLAIDLVVPEHVVEPWTAALRWETMIIERIDGFGGRVRGSARRRG